MTDFCTPCDGRCCNHYIVPITHFDVKRIVEAGFEPAFFVDFFHVGDTQCDYQDIRLGHMHKYMILKRNPGGACIFSLEKDGKLRCGIHASHPMLCRVYPYNPSTGKIRVKNLCRKNANPGKPDKELFKQELEEASEYNKKVRMWNALDAPKDAQSFISYILGK